MTPDRLEKEATFAQPLDRVWRAVSDAHEFGLWFGVAFDGSFAEGKPVTGRIVPTSVDPEVAKLQRPYEGHPFEFTVERIEPPRRISFRWHPFAIDRGYDYSQEPMTLIVFELAEVPGGTRLTISESGFEGIPIGRRADAFRASEGGWSHQLGLVRKYLEAHAA